MEAITKDEMREVLIEVLTPFYQVIGGGAAIVIMLLVYFLVIDPFMKRNK